MRHPTFALAAVLASVWSGCSGCAAVLGSHFHREHKVTEDEIADCVEVIAAETTSALGIAQNPYTPPAEDLEAAERGRVRLSRASDVCKGTVGWQFSKLAVDRLEAISLCRMGYRRIGLRKINDLGANAERYISHLPPSAKNFKALSTDILDQIPAMREKCGGLPEPKPAPGSDDAT